MKVYIVFGQTGEYSDRTDWPVRGFFSKEIAERFEFECTKWAKALSDRIEAHEECDKCFTESSSFKKCPANETPPHDPGFKCDYTGTDYYTVEVEVEP